MTTVGQLVDTTIRQHLEMGGPTQLNRLQTGINASVEDLVLDWEPEVGLAPGTYIEIGSEALLVVQSQGIYVSVLRAQWGTTADTHSALDMIRIKPRFLRSQVLTEIVDEISTWPPTLFGVTTADVDWATGDYDHDLTGATGKAVTRLLAVELEPNTAEPWGDLRTSYSIHPADTGAYPSGWRLHTLRPSGPEDVRVTYAHEFNLTALATEATDLQSGCGLSATMNDIARFGAAGRLMLSQEAERARLDMQGTTRFAEEVPPQHQVTAAQALLEMRDRRLMQEEERLVSRWGV
jgi:hypothetical protein